MAALHRPATAPRVRVTSVDALRGIAMIIMALDHVRDYWCPIGFDPTDVGQTTPALFLTRWITHFCAPLFMFLAGTSAWLYQSSRAATAGALARFLASRGLWLIVVGSTWVSFAWIFSFDYIILQVIWALGWSMIILALLVFLPRPAIWAIAIGAIFGHNLLDGISPDAFGRAAWAWMIIHVPGFITAEGLGPLTGFKVNYPLLPWFGVMALGYLLGPSFQAAPAIRARRFTLLGLGCLAAFIALRAGNFYGDAHHWSVQPAGLMATALSFIDVTKYPPSLLYLLITLGPGFLAVPLLEKWDSPWRDRLATYGRVPFFYYMIHIPLIHAAAMIWQQAAFGMTFDDIDIHTAAAPAGYVPRLWLAYLVWAAVVLCLYLPCRWFAGVKARNKAWWLSYL